CDLAPRADFKTKTTSGVAPLNVDFDDFSSGDIETWSWDFGDATGSKEANPSHVYAEPGVYTVTLEVENACGCDALVRENYIEVVGDDLPSAVHVAAQRVRREYLGQGRYRAVDEIRIENANGAPVENALVTA